MATGALNDRFLMLASYAEGNYRYMLAIDTSKAPSELCIVVTNMDGTQVYNQTSFGPSSTIRFGSGTSTVSLRANLTTVNNSEFMRIINVNQWGSAVVMGAGGNTLVGSGESAWSIYDSNIDNAKGDGEYLYLSSDGPVYVYTSCNTIANRRRWTFETNGVLTLPSVPNATDIYRAVSYTGSHSKHVTRNNGITLSTSAVKAPTANAYDGIYTTDSANNIVGCFEHVAHTNGSSYMQMYARRWNGSAIVGNYFAVGVNSSGASYYTVTSPAAFRSAIGLSDTTTTITAIASVITAATNVTINSVEYVQWGKVAQVSIYFKYNAAIAVPVNGNITNINVGTLVSGKRPKIRTAFYGDGDNNGQAFGSILTTGVVQIGGFDARNAAYTIAAGGQFRITATYILA